MLNIINLPERQADFIFTAPYAKSVSGVFVLNKNRHQYSELSDLNGKTVAIPKGFDLEISLPKHYPEIKILLVKNILEAIDVVRSGKADALIEELSVVDYIISQGMISDLRFAFKNNDPDFIRSLSIATSHENRVLLSIIHKGLNTIPVDELNSIRKKWLLQVHDIYEKSTVNLSVTEKEYIYQHNQVNICVDPTWPPLDFIDEYGLHSGLSASLINKLAARIGVTLNLVTTHSWKETLQFIEQKKCDIIPLMNETEVANSYLNFSQAYFQFATVIATRKNASYIGDYYQLYGKKVALQSYFFITEYVRKNHPEIEIVEVENTKEALQMVNEQQVFATIDGLPNIVNNIEALALENIKVVGAVPQENSMKMGVRKDNEILLSIFNKGIASLSEREKISLYKKWFDIEVVSQLFNRDFIVKVVIVFSLAFLFLLWRQITLKKHTVKLQDLNRKLSYLSSTDHLTKIYNRQTIEAYLNAEIQKAQMNQQAFSILLLDIDHFKQVNDTFGHLAGDAVLQKISTLIMSTIRKSDYIGRWGGEEFLLIIPEAQAEQAERIANELRAKIEHFDFELNMAITASFGVAQYQFNEDRNSFLSRVDDSLYEAKKLGRNQVVSAKV